MNVKKRILVLSSILYQRTFNIIMSLNSFCFSLANVSKDVEEHSDQIEKLEIGVAGTKVVLKRVHRDVKKQGKDLEGVKEGLDDVNTRVDNVEVDVEETKERVEEVDKKVVKTST